MPEILYATRGTQIGVESTPGTGVAANHKLQGISISPAIKLDIQTYRALGNKFMAIAAPGNEYVTAKLSGFPTYDEIGYLLAGICYAAPAQQGGTAAYKQTCAPALSAADAYKAFSVEQGDSTRAQKFYGAHVNDLNFEVSREGIGLDGSLIGLALQDNITMTAGPTVFPMIPILPTQFDVKLVATNQAGLAGSSALTRCKSASFGFGGKWLAPVFLGSAQTGFIPGVENPEPKVTSKLKLAMDSTGMGLLTQMRAGSSLWIRIKATGALIAGAYYYDMQTDISCKIVGEPSEPTNEQGIACVEWQLEAAYDSTWGKTIQIDLINTQTAIS